MIADCGLRSEASGCFYPMPMLFLGHAVSAVRSPQSVVGNPQSPTFLHSPCLAL
jgi:hypothetical protein